MDKLGSRNYRRSILRGYVTELRRNGLFAEVRARASVELASCLDDPRNAPEWLGPALPDELFAIVAALGGRDAVRELGYQSMIRGGFKTNLAPIIHLSRSMLGVSPGSVLSSTQALVSVNTRGFEAKWTPTAKCSGTVRLRCDEPVKELSWAAWEGVLLSICDLSMKGCKVAAARPAPDGRSCEVDVSWEPEAK